MARLWVLVDRRALLVTAACLVVWRLLYQIPVAGLIGPFLTTRLELGSAPGFFPAIGYNSIPLSAYSLAYVGITPYVQALVIVSLLAAVLSSVRSNLASGHGRLRLERWTRVLAMCLALGEAYSWTKLAQDAGAVPWTIDWFARLAICLELVGGTAVVILLADLLDEFGLGFGYGALLLYALGPLALKVHRIADYLASTPSLEASYRPLAIWAAFTLCVTVASVAVMLAIRRVPSPRASGAERGAPTELRLLASGMLRPPQFTFALIALPALTASLYLDANPSGAQWLMENWTPYGASPWLDVAYVVVEVVLVVFFAWFVAAVEFRAAGAPAHLAHHVVRLALLGGCSMAVLGVVGTVANHLATRRVGQVIAMSGFDVLLTVAMVLLVILWIEGRAARAVPFAVSATRLP
ncbi:MAG TPA: hypothetical protein VEM94_05275 [Candidatus Dormibacteraeota bacterium]|nr:hypothetical protein [Candidatus Dormibacteraeota bacterium]